ncbi:MAG: tetraacyldisaccharide 4'-kinase [Ferruginibacter sp.]
MKQLRTFLYPLSFLYGGVLRLRHWLFDREYLKSSSFNFPIICVGNLATGGTGKTPMVEYLVDMLKDHYKIATLSRGYKRKTTGFAIANEHTTALDIGDEPMQFHEKYPELAVAVGEERLAAIPQLLHAKPATELIILDDAFQHRQVRAGLNILLTDHKNIYTKDLLLPAGNLRDVPSAAKRAQVIIVTKCRSDLDITEKEKIIKSIRPLPQQEVFFAETVYSRPYHLFNRSEANISPETIAVLISGIANPAHLQEFLKKNMGGVEMMRFADHHIFSTDDLRQIIKQFDELKTENKIILTTEKDGVRLKKFEKELAGYPVYVLPIKHHFLFYEGQKFEELVIKFINSFYSVQAG